MITVISGLIGVGKSTLCNNLEADVKLFEPVETNAYLNSYYENPSEYALRMQLNLLIKRFKSMGEAMRADADGKTVLLDRSIYEDFAFLRVQDQLGYIDARDRALYEDYYNTFTGLLRFPDLVIYLDSPRVIDIAMERMAARGRGCESGVSRGYMTLLHEAYLELMPELAQHTRVVTIDPDKDAAGVCDAAKKAVLECQLKKR